MNSLITRSALQNLTEPALIKRTDKINEKYRHFAANMILLERLLGLFPQ